MNNRIKFTCLIVLIFICFAAHSQYFEETEDFFHKLTIESGLSQNKVNCILRDRSGFVWFGTGNGLNRFDGENVLVVEKDFGDEYNLKDIEIFDLYQESGGDIWIASEKGLFKYNAELENFNRFLLSGSLEREPYIRCVEPENDSVFWLGTSDGLKLFDKQTGAVLEEYRNKPYEPYTLSNDNIYAVCKIENEIWIGTDEGVNVFDKNRKLFNRHFHDVNNKNSIASNTVRKIISDPEGNIWLGTEYGGLSKYNISEKIFRTFNTENSGIPHNDIRDIFDLRNGNLWLATNGGGLALFNKKTLEFNTYSYNPLNINGLSNNSVYSVFEDYEGVLWLGFYAGGVNFKASNINDFKTVAHLPGNSNSICESNARSLFLDSDQNLWVGTFGGLSFFENKEKTYRSFVSIPNNPGTLSFNTVTTVCQDSKKNIWVGTYSGGVNLFDPDSETFQHFHYDPLNENSISGENIYSITEDPDGKIWVATSSGLNRYNQEDKNWERILKNDIRDIVFIGKEKMFLAVYNGVIEYNLKSGTFEHFFNDELAAAALTVVLLNDNDSKIWFGTQGDGFGYFNLETKTFTNYSTKDGLPSNFIASIERYGETYLWLSTYKGLSLFDINSQQFMNFGMAEGVPFLEFHPKSSAVLPDSTFAFGGSNGIVVFNPEEVINKKPGSKLRFSSFKIDGNIVEVGEDSPLSKNINLVDEIKLSYSQNDFVFDFVDINFKSRGLTNFEYKLENYMNDWANIGNQNSVGFTNMDPGKYELKIRKLGGNAQKGFQDEISMRIEIVPPFWMTWYFYLFMFLFVVGIMFIYNKYSLITISQKNEIRLKNLEYEKFEEFSKLRMKFFTYISHELRTPLSLIVDPLSRLLELNKGNENQKYLRLIENNSDRLKRLVDQILDFRKLENDALSLIVEKREIAKEVSVIYSSFEETAKSENIKYTFENQLSEKYTGWIDIDKLEKIMYNLLSNAFKFTREEGEVIVGLSAPGNDNRIELVIKDNGFGLRPDKLQHIFEYFYTDDKHSRYYKGGVGIGLTYVKRMVDLHHATISVDSEENKGTSFTIGIPVNKDEYSEEEIGRPESVIKKPVIDFQETNKLPIVEPKLPKHGKKIPLIMVVEDEPELREYLVFRLRHTFRVVEAVNGKDALDKLGKDIPDLILSDNVMPVMDGIEFCNELKGKDEFSHIPFLFLSAWNSDDFKMKGLKEGAEDYISKPFNYEMLQTKISNIIEKRKALLEVAGQIVKVKPGKVKIETTDERFILKAQEVIERNIDNLEFKTKQFEDELSMSHSAVYRKIKTLTALSPNEFIREFKIRRAAQIILQDKNLTVMEVSLRVGYVDQKYFSRCFKNVMGMSPSEYAVKGEKA